MHRRVAGLLLLLGCSPGKSGDGGESDDGGARCADCDDGIDCTTDTCVGGECLHEPDDAECDDALFCNGVETCVAAKGCAPGEPESCDDGLACTDDSCDAAADECVHDADAPTPGAPPLFSPWNGSYTGLSRRPTLRWSAVVLEDGETPTYDLVADDSCDVGAHTECDMPSPEVDETGIETTEWTPADDLPASDAPPVGARYAWRVRACHPCSGECGPWSAGRYLEVGRDIADLSGDGFADVVVGAHGQDWPVVDEGNAYFYAGGADGLEASPSVTLDNPANQISGYFGYHLAAVGDVNGDGFGDLVVGAFAQDGPETDEGAVYVFHGGLGGPGAAPARTLDNPVDHPSGRFGVAVAGAGDVNGDGWSDVVVGADQQDWPEADEGVAYVFHGGPEGVAETPAATIDNPLDQATGYFGRSVAGAGDVDADGFADVVVGAFLQDGPEMDEGNAYVFRGGPLGVDPAPAASLDNPRDQPAGRFGFPVAGVGDLDGDGYGDIAVSAYLQDLPGFDEGVVYLYRGGDGGIADGAEPSTTLDNFQDQAYGQFGVGLARAGDVNGDGLHDLLVGAYAQDGPETDEGWAFLYLGRSEGVDPLGAIAFDGPFDQATAYFGYALAGVGDVNGDGYGDVVVAAHAADDPETDEGAATLYLGGEAGIDPAAPWGTLDNPLDQAWGYFGVALAAGRP